MTNEQKFHLNRLAETLVTRERYGPFSDDALALMQWVRKCRTFVEKSRNEGRRVELSGCPYGNADCKVPGLPVGYGHHAECSTKNMSLALTRLTGKPVQS